MNFLPTTADTSFATTDFFLMVAAVLVPALIALFIWILFFKNRRKRKRKRRQHEDSATSQPISQAGGLPPIRKPESWTDEP